MSEAGSGAYAALLADLRETEILGSTVNLLSWDQETMMPAGGAQLRAEQIGMLSALAHERATHPKIGEWLAECEADESLLQDDDAAANVREIRRAYDRAVLLPRSLVRELAETTARAQPAWRAARERSDFGEFRPWLEKVLDLTRARGECLVPAIADTPYGALVDAYEPGATAAELDQLFARLRSRLTPLIEAIAERPAPRHPTRELSIPVPRQVAFGTRVTEAIGFDLTAGRLDTSTHPFCQGIGPGDTRLTTRYREDRFLDAISSTLHEAGHGLYEQGLPKESRFGQPLAEPASLGIHESQSRLWENFVGRSRPFWQWALPLARDAFGEAVGALSLDEVHREANAVEPHFIRVESDELTYNLHIVLRFDLERALLSRELAVADLPGAWNQRMLADLGLRVPDDARGCLQDIHWAMGAFGYFPTYTLGNLYAAQFWTVIDRDIPELDEQVARGEFAPLLDWLRRNIHRHGRKYSAAELCERITGRPLSEAPLVEYLEAKLGPLYDLS